ncbi:acyltransferase family protein [Phyllobacterium leguminum]|uniref:Succinoglycan biosynthesis protein ExoH n=1 Tax=Phyllobacterium leguminum TaxID=314237 RepID=A0A318TCJ6_9HYPH|nr:acyltransferase [Phyllobacterium leguminum]PYE88802.1 succinoglycan biosynthesis protein ExoH [Phyllobacterium leguminum]
MDANISARINLLRIALICGIVLVHVPYGPETTPFNGNNGAVDWLRVFLAESVFRVGVPCLSAISGYLLLRKGLKNFDYGQVLGRKMQSILLPLLIWNGAFFLFVLIMQSRGIGEGYLPDVTHARLPDLFNLLFALNGEPINLPLYFLRDLFACILLSPVLAFLVTRYPIPTLAILLVLTVVSVPIYIVLRPSILLSFSLGMAFAIHKVDLRRMDPYAAPVLAAFLAASTLLAAALYHYGPDYPYWLEVIRNLFILIGIPGFWALSALLIQSEIGRQMARTGGLSFWIFCAHYPVLLMLWMIWNRVHPSEYVVFYAGALAVGGGLLLLSNEIARRTFPSAYALLVGSRG